ncbi:hypothetical protein OAS39_05065 [Pirellulales bacterium]|nr:hypothetical protein [Pirellulales bacterium]
MIGVVGVIASVGLGDSALGARYDGVLTLNVADETTGQPLAARLELRNARGRAVRIRPPGATLLDDGIYFAGSVELRLRRGAYQFLIEAGPEYRTRPGNFTIDRRGEGVEHVTLLRRVDMASEGWFAGDLDVQLPLEAAEIAMQARGVDYVPVTVSKNIAGKCLHLIKPANFAKSSAAPPLLFGPWTTLDARRGGGVLFVGRDQSVDVCSLARDDRCNAGLQSAHEAGARSVARSATAWELPIWAASGLLDAVQIVEGAQAATNDDHDRPPPNPLHYPGKLGHGRWAEAVYHHLLNCGLRIPPAAGSGAGSDDDPLGAGRVYTYCGDQFTRDGWLDALLSGRVVVTNGPLLRPRVEGRAPGHIFPLDDGDVREFQIALDLAFYEQAQVDYLELVKNGRVEHEIRLDELAAQAGKLPPLTFDESGWFLVRAITNNANYYQFASSGPYYVESNDQPRVSAESIQFFLNWLADAETRFADDAAALADIAKAREFWIELSQRATAE